MSRQPGKRIVVVLTPSQHHDLQTKAQKLGLSLGNMIRRVLLFPDIRRGQRTDLKSSRPPAS